MNEKPIASLAICSGIVILMYSINFGIDITVTTSIATSEKESIKYNRIVHTDSDGNSYINVYGTKYYLSEFMRIDY